MGSSMLGTAMEYAERGWKVFPLHTAKNSVCSCGNDQCKSAAKHPRIKEWQHCCTDKEGDIKDWWGKWHDANIGLATGHMSGFFVLDIDPRHGGKESLQDLIRRNGLFPKTLSSHTGGGGYHLFFKEPAIKITNRSNVLPGIDVRGDGGYIVAPPSFHQSGRQYSWMKDNKDAEIEHAPVWLLDLLTGAKAKNLHRIVEGGRNSFLTSEAGKLRRSGLNSEEIFCELQKINNASCMPPLEEAELRVICKSVGRYPSATNVVASQVSFLWLKEPQQLITTIKEVPSLPAELLPETFRPWIVDVSERMQVAPEFVMAPALVSLSSIVGRRLGIFPKQHDDWLVVPNLWGLIVARPGYFKSPTIAEAMKPLERLSEAARKENEANMYQAKASQMLASMQLEAVREVVKKAIKDGDGEKIDALKDQVAELEQEAEAAMIAERRYKTNDATIEKLARLLNENPNGLLLLRDELNGWFELLHKAGREGDREFFLEAWNGYGSFSIDRVGSGTLHVPALCLSIFGGIQPGKLQAYVEKSIQGTSGDDGLLQRFQILIYPEFSPKWHNIDRSPNIMALEQVNAIFQKIDAIGVGRSRDIPGVNFTAAAQDVFNAWRQQLETRLRSEEIGCPALESHLAKYRSLMPSLALLFWVLENPENIHGNGSVSLTAALLAIEWCAFLEKHALKAYAIGQNSEALAAKRLAECIEQGLIGPDETVRGLYRKQWTHLRTPYLVDQALETLEEFHWLRIVNTAVQGGRTKKIELHPKFRASQPQEKNYEHEIKVNHSSLTETHRIADRTALLGADRHQI